MSKKKQATVKTYNPVPSRSSSAKNLEISINEWNRSSDEDESLRGTWGLRVDSDFEDERFADGVTGEDIFEIEAPCGSTINVHREELRLICTKFLEFIDKKS
jgi:hypothetical protein